jgi:hypothetical protein
MSVDAMDLLVAVETICMQQEFVSQFPYSIGSSEYEELLAQLQEL